MPVSKVAIKISKLY